MIGANCTQKTPLWQVLQYRKRCLFELEQRNFEINHDYDVIFNRIHKELSNEYSTEKTIPNSETSPHAGEQESER